MSSTRLASAPTQMISRPRKLATHGGAIYLEFILGVLRRPWCIQDVTPLICPSRRAATQNVFTHRMSSLRGGAAVTRWPLAIYIRTMGSIFTRVLRIAKRGTRLYLHFRRAPAASSFVDTSFIYHFQMPLAGCV